MQRFNEPFPVLEFVLTIQAAKAFLVAFPLLIEVLRPIMSFLDDIPSTFWRKRDMVELMYDFNGWTLLLNSLLTVMAKSETSLELLTQSHYPFPSYLLLV